MGLIGCEALPNVSYALVETPSEADQNQVASYALQETVLVFEENKDGTLAVTVAREDHQANRVAMIDSSDFGVNSDIAVVNFSNTDIPKEITVKVVDGRKELVEKVGGLLVTAVKSSVLPFSGVTDPIRPPFSVNASTFAPNNRANREEEVVIDEPGKNMKLVYGPVPVDAIATSTLSNQPKGPYFYYAACRHVEAQFYVAENNKKAQRTVRFKASDPQFLQRARLPIDGKITMHDQCGASVTGKLKGTDGAEIALIQALIKQADAVNEAIEKQNEARKTQSQ